MKWISVIALLCLSIGLQNNVRAQSDTLPHSFEIKGTQVLKLSSKINGQDYQLYINLPGSYLRDTAKTYPVVYLLDGQWDFPLFTGIYGSQYYDGFLPEFITVGITWAGKDPNYDELRTRDLTPTHIADQPSSGGGPKFLEVIKKEFIPFINSKYRATSDRTLVGSSLGGLFTLYTLCSDPSLFHRYVLTSPSLWWDNGALRTYKKDYETSGSTTPVRLFMAIGGLETDVAQFQQFATQLRERKVKGLELHTRILENTGHSGSTAEGFTRGLQYVFEKPSLTLSPAIIDRYSGTYQFETVTVTLSLKNGKLFAVTPEASYVLQAETQRDFYVKGAFINVHFKTDDSGKVTGFQLDQFAGGIFMKKVK